MTAQSYPRTWPQGFPRSTRREGGQFKTDYDRALRNVIDSLRRFGADSGKKIEHPVMSSNMDLLNRRPADPGIAVWFVWDGMQVCIPVDRYDSPAANLQAIRHIIEARRTELRHGTLALVRATFTGFKALPPPAGKHWRDILSLPVNGHATREMVEIAFRKLATERHPDKGGSTDAMAELNTARELALKELPA